MSAPIIRWATDHDEEMWELPQSIRPWTKDTSWNALVRQAWYRMRPFEGKVTLHGYDQAPVENSERWGLWLVSFSMQDPNSGELRERHFGLKDGNLEEADLGGGLA
jgi:hypothetical protein